jgi:long-chain acyl-CoA synthetase
VERIWLKNYPAGTPAEIDMNEFSSLKDVIERSFELFPERTAFIQMGTHLGYRELDELSARFAAWLQQRGFKKGDRFAIMLPNVLQYPVAMFGALRAGLVVVNTNPLYTAHELEYQLRDSGAAGLLVLENFASVAEMALPGTSVREVVVTGAGDMLGFPKAQVVNFVLRHVQKKVPAWRLPKASRFMQILKTGPEGPEPVEVGHDDLAFLQYTGGTTGVAKGAMLTHGNLVSNLLQARAWFRQVDLNMTNYVCALPLYHVFSLTANCLLFTSVGGRGLLITNPRDFKGFVKELQAFAPNFFLGVNTLFNALMDTPGFEKIDFKRLLATVGGGMAVQRVVAERWKKLTGCTLSQGWGLTETSPIACVCLLIGQEFTGTIGLPVPSTEVSMRDDDGKELPIGELGEICVRGPQVMRGYWQRPDETAKVMLSDGWLRTGDIGHMDSEGFVYIDDRKKDMIIVSGFKVFPAEVEDVVAACPGVSEVAAVAQPDAKSGEVVALFIVRKDPALTEAALAKYCHDNLTAYKRPRTIIFRKELPKTNVGKIMRRALRDELAGG